MSNAERTLGYSARPGFSWGAFFKTKKNELGLLESISLFITDNGFPEAPVSIRFFEFTGTFDYSTSFDHTQFKDLTEKPIIFSAKEPGWQTIDLTDFNIALPKSGIYCLVSPLDKGPQFFYDTRFGKKYGASIGIYAKKSDQRRIFPMLQQRDKFTVLKNVEAPAISLTYQRAR